MPTNKDKFVRNVFSIVAPHVDPLSTAFSFGLCHAWRRRLVARAGLKKNDRVLDVCTGTGEVASLLMKQIGKEGHVTGIDFCEDMLAIARKKMGPKENLSLMVANAKQMDFANSTFDLVTVAFGMRNIPDTAAAIKEIARVLKPGGRFLTLELTRPVKRWFVPIYRWYVFKVIPFIGKMITKNALPYSYLPVSIETYYSPDEYRNIIRKCGFSRVEVYSLSLGIATIYRAVKSA
jgi:demethylmenaquinone methyltransferase / 2-methoxy-6-polyprenyl-1,4-benzoquinol methylase